MKPLEALKRIRQETCPATILPDFDKEECCKIIEDALEDVECVKQIFNDYELEYKLTTLREAVFLLKQLQSDKSQCWNNALNKLKALEIIKNKKVNVLYLSYYFVRGGGGYTEYKRTCLDRARLCDYLERSHGYAIHIKKLKVFDNPKKLNHFKVRWREKDKEVKDLFGHNAIAFKWLEKAPQNMCEVYQLSADGEYYDEYALISIQPQWLVKILNGEKTIEVRKKVLRDMLCQD